MVVQVFCRNPRSSAHRETAGTFAESGHEWNQQPPISGGSSIGWPPRPKRRLSMIRLRNSDPIERDGGRRAAGHHPTVRRWSRRCIASMAVGADGGAGAVVLKRAGTAGPGTSGRRCGLDDGESECESKNSPGQHDHSPGDEALSGFCRQDRGARRLFPCTHSNAVRRVQVRVSAIRAAVHIAVICSVTAS